MKNKFNEATVMQNYIQSNKLKVMQYSINADLITVVSNELMSICCIT